MYKSSHEESTLLEKKLIKEWFSNVNEGRINDSILVLRNFPYEENLIAKIRITLKKSSSQYLKNIVINVTNIIKSELDKNTIIILPVNINKKPTLSAKKILDISIQESILDFDKNMEQYINSTEYSNITSTIDKNEIYQHFVQKFDPVDFLSNHDNDIESFINTLLKKHSLWIEASYNSSFPPLLHIINGTSYKIESFEPSIQGDILILIHDNILTSRLAVVVYRATKLDSEASTVKIGRYYHEILGSKSKTFNPGHPRLNFIHQDFRKKSFKGYDLRVKESELAIRREIAKKLISLNLEELDRLTIATIAGLKEADIEKLKNFNS